MMRAAATLAVLLAAAASLHAQATISIDDAWVVEGAGSVTVTVRASSSSWPVTVQWKTVDGSAKAGADYVGNAGSALTFSDATPKTVTVTIINDGVDEWSATRTDEAFFIQLDPPFKARGTVTIIDDDEANPRPQFVSAVADGPAGAGRVRLQWRVPAPRPDDVMVRWTTAPSPGPRCTPPSTTSSGTGGLLSGPPWNKTLDAAGETQMVEHAGLQLDRFYCYALFAMYSGTPSQPLFVTAVTFASDGPSSEVAWAYSVGTYNASGAAPAIVPPTVGTDAVYTIDNDGVVHAMARGESGGTWPDGAQAWHPVGLGKPASNRSPVVPLAQGSRLFVGTENGEVHAVDGLNGAIAWSRSGRFGGALPYLPGVQATPAGLFTSWGGNNDLILVGTNNGTSNNEFHMLDPVTGVAVVGSPNPYTLSSLGAIAGMAAVDYPRTAYLLANGATTGALWALDLGDKDVPAVTLAAGYPVTLTAGWVAIGSPVIRNGRIYFGTTNGTQSELCMVAGGTKYGAPTMDGNIKQFVFPDRRNGNLYVATDTRVTQWKDTPGLTSVYSWNVASPSAVLYRPNTDFLYVGSSDGQLYQLNVADHTTRSVLLDGSQVGAPSLDGPNNLVLVGSANGVVYAVRADPTTGIPWP